MIKRLIFLATLTLFFSCQNQQKDNEMLPTAAPIRIVFFGNSLTAAYGLEPEQGFVALLRQKAAKAGFAVETLNAGISGETTAGGLLRIDYILEEPLDVLVLELGINDAFYGEEASRIQQNLQEMIDRTRAAHPQARILLLGIRPPEDAPFAQPRAVYELYGELARVNDAALVPDLIEKVRKRPRKYLFDDIHPNAEGHRQLAETIWPVLKQVLKEAQQRAGAT
jgi:acyl-CoA thioesterase-1